MDISHNKDFKSVNVHTRIPIKSVLDSYYTQHLKDERKKRIDLALKLNEWTDGTQAEVDAVFLVDKGHKNGKELHCVTKKGIIFILNERKYILHQNAFITALIARPNQVKRLYDNCGLHASEKILSKCRNNQISGFNKIDA